MMSGAAVVGNNAVMTGEGQVVKLNVATQNDALADRIGRSGAVQRLTESRACSVVAPDIAFPLVAVVADAVHIAAIQSVNVGVVTVADIVGTAVADQVIHLVKVEHHVVCAIASTIDRLVDVLRHQVDDAFVVRRTDIQVTHVDGRLLRRLRDLIGHLHIHANGRRAGVVVRVDVTIGIVIGIGIAVQIAVDVAVLGVLVLALRLALALTLALCLSLYFALGLSLRFELLLQIVLIVVVVVVGRFRRLLWHGVSPVR